MLSKIYFIATFKFVSVSKQNCSSVFNQEHDILTFRGTPQGFLSSSDELISATDIAFAGLPAMKMMDDILIEGSSIEVLMKKSRLLFQSTREKETLLL